MKKVALVTGIQEVTGTFGSTQIICSDSYPFNQIENISPIQRRINLFNNKVESTVLNITYFNTSYRVPQPNWEISLVNYHFASPDNGFGTVESVFYNGIVDSVKENNNKFYLTAYNVFDKLFNTELLTHYTTSGTSNLNAWQSIFTSLNGNSGTIKNSGTELLTPNWLFYLFGTGLTFSSIYTTWGGWYHYFRDTLTNGKDFFNNLLNESTMKKLPTEFSSKTIQIEYSTTQDAGTNMFSHPKPKSEYITFNVSGTRYAEDGTYSNEIFIKADDTDDILKHLSKFPYKHYLNIHHQINNITISNDLYSFIRGIITNADNEFMYHNNTFAFQYNEYAQNYASIVLLLGTVSTNTTVINLLQTLLKNTNLYLTETDNKIELKTLAPVMQVNDVSNYIINNSIEENIFDTNQLYDSLSGKYSYSPKKSYIEIISGTNNTLDMTNEYIHNISTLYTSLGRYKRLLAQANNIKFSVDKSYGTLNLLDVISISSYAANKYYSITSIKDDIYKQQYECDAMSYAYFQYPAIGSVEQHYITDTNYPTNVSLTSGAPAGQFCDFPKVPSFTDWSEDDVPIILAGTVQIGTNGTYGTLTYTGKNGIALLPYQPIGTKSWHLFARSTYPSSFNDFLELYYLGKLTSHYPVSGTQGIGTVGSYHGRITFERKYNNTFYNMPIVAAGQYLCLAGSESISEYLNEYGTIRNLPEKYGNNNFKWY